MGFVAGVLLAAKGGVALAPLWAALSSSLWISGTMSFAAVPEIAARSPVATLVLLTVAVNFRYVFYGFSMLERWRRVPFLQKAYLILMLTDENYALETAAAAKRLLAERDALRYRLYGVQERLFSADAPRAVSLIRCGRVPNAPDRPIFQKTVYKLPKFDIIEV